MTATERQTVADAFVDLWLDDDELVRAEFDALIADCWESPCEPPRHKPAPPDRGWYAGPPPRWPRRSVDPFGVPVAAGRPRGRGRDPPRTRRMG